MTPRAEKRSHELLNTARKVVADGGFRALSMQALADAAGVAVGTPYRYFPSKAELCARLVARVSKREFDVLTTIASTDSPAPERLAIMAGTFTRRALQAPNLAYAIIAEPVDPEVEDVRLKWRGRIAALFANVLADGVRDKYLVCDDPEIAAACVTGAMMEAIIFSGRATSDRQDYRAIAGQVAAFCLRGVTTQALDDTLIQFDKEA